LSEAAVVSYSFEQLEHSNPPARDAPERMLAQAELDAAQLREQARAEGYEDGRRAGLENAAQEISSATGALAEVVREVESLRGEMLEGLERDAIELSLELSGKILGATVKRARTDAVLETVQGALRRISDRRKIVVLVNPSDLDTLRPAIGELGAAGGVELCDLQPDERVPAGSAVVRTAEGEVDASVHTQLERAREVVEASIEAREPPA